MMMLLVMMAICSWIHSLDEIYFTLIPDNHIIDVEFGYVGITLIFSADDWCVQSPQHI